MKYGIWLDEWFCNYIRPSSKRRTCERYSEIIEKRLKVKLGEYELDELTPLVLQRYITELIESGNMKTGKSLAANSVNGIITVIQNSLKLAYALGTIKEYAADKIRRPKTKEKEVTCFTLSEQKKIERAALAGKKTKWLGIVVCLYTGLRIGELLALEWKDVDFQKGVLISADQYELIGTLSKSLGELNLYSYCANNPIMYTDESGTLVWSTVLIIVGVVAGLVAGGYIGYTSVVNDPTLSTRQKLAGIGLCAILGGIAGGFFGAD